MPMPTVVRERRQLSSPQASIGVALDRHARHGLGSLSEPFGEIGHVQLGEVDGPAVKAAFGPKERLFVNRPARGIVEHSPKGVRAVGAWVRLELPEDAV